MGLAVAAACASRAAALEPEQAVEAAVAYNVLKFVEWPREAPLHGSAWLELCVVADPRFAEVAAAGLAGRAVGGRVLRIRQVADGDHAGCHAAFIGAVPDVERTAFLLAQAGVVTFAHGPGLGARGVMFAFHTEGDRIRFEVNLAATRRAGLRVSARLLSLAVVVREDAQ